MAPVVPNGLQQNNSIKVKRAAPSGAQTNGGTSSTPSPSLSAAKKPQPATKPPTPNTANERTITASTVRPVNRVRRETNGQLGRNSRNSAGLRSGELTSDGMPQGGSSRPYVVTDAYVLKRHVGQPPSLILHLHPHHFRFDAQDGVFSYASPMKIFIQHLRARTVPHDLLEQFILGGVAFYDGCLIVQVHDHRTLAREADAARPTSSSSNAAGPSSINSYSQYLTPSPYGTIPKEELTSGDGQKPTEESKDTKNDKEKSEDVSAVSTVSETKKSKSAAKAKVYTVVLHPTAESMQRDLALCAMMGMGKGDARGGLETPGVGPPSTPMSLVPPTPTASSMPPPAKRQKRDKAELDATNITAAEGQILLATQAPLILDPAATSIEEQIALLNSVSHPKHSEAPPQPKARKRTVAEVAADEAAAAEQEKYMLLADDRYGALGSQATAAGDADAQAGSTSFEPRFERFKVIADIQRELSEKKEQEKIKQQENDRRLQQQRMQQQQEALQAQQRQQAEAEKARREAAQAAQREAMAARQAAQEQQRQQQLAAQRAAAATPVSQANNAGNAPQPQHAHPAQANGMQNGMVNGGVQQNAVPNGMNAQAQARFPPQITQAQASSPVVRQGTPQNHSSPMVNGGIPMQQTSSTMAASPPRPTSVVQNPSMSVPMAHAMSARGSQQSHPSNTPRMPHSTPNMAHGTPVSRHMAATPRMTQASPPPQMMNQGSQMGQMMMNNQAMNQANPQMIAQMAAQQRALAVQQQQANMQQNGGMPGQMSHQQMMLMQRQLMIQQQQQQQQAQQQQQHQQHQQQQMQHQQQQQGMPNNQQLAQQYAQHIQNMQGQQMRNMTPQMQAQLMARMQQAQQQQQMNGNNMQRQQMMNGNNMNAILQMQQQQAQRQQQLQAQQQAQQMGQQQQQQQPQQMGGQQQQQQSALHTQVQNVARGLYQRMLQEATTKYGGREHIPPELVETCKSSSLQQAQNMVRHNVAQRQAQFAQQQQMMLQQQQAQQAQQQGHQQMQGMGGMMGHQQM